MLVLSTKKSTKPSQNSRKGSRRLESQLEQAKLNLYRLKLRQKLSRAKQRQRATHRRCYNFVVDICDSLDKRRGASK